MKDKNKILDTLTEIVREYESRGSDKAYAIQKIIDDINKGKTDIASIKIVEKVTVKKFMGEKENNEPFETLVKQTEL